VAFIGYFGLNIPRSFVNVGEYNNYDPKDGELYRGRMKPTETLVEVLLRC